jgi:hypothetical protein
MTSLVEQKIMQEAFELEEQNLARIYIVLKYPDETDNNAKRTNSNERSNLVVSMLANFDGMHL